MAFKRLDKLFLIILIILIVCLIYSLFTNKNPTIRETYAPNIAQKLTYRQRVYLEVLKRTKIALDSLSIPFFLSSGTCLGYFREKNFIKYDYDIDIGIFRENYTHKMVKAMKKVGLKLYRTLGELESGLELSFFLPGTKLGRWAKVDIFLHYKDQDKGTISWYSYSPDKKRIQYRVNAFDISVEKFLGVDVGVPSPTLDYIVQHYGSDWNIPKRPRKDYLYYQDPLSIVKD